MSGRSAHVRRKGLDTKPAGRPAAPRVRDKSGASPDNAKIPGYAPGPRHEWDRGWIIPDAGMANAPFLNLSDLTRDEMLAYYNGRLGYRNRNSGSQSGSSLDGTREDSHGPHLYGPLDGSVYGRAWGPTTKAEEMPAIEKSGLRTVLDKKSNEVRNGLAKAFTFKKHDKADSDTEVATGSRPQSSTTVRPFQDADIHPGDLYRYRGDIPPVRYQVASLNPGFRRHEAGGMALSPPSDGLPFVPERGSTPPIRRWIGAGRSVERWKKVGDDGALWDPNGDVLVFLGETDKSQPNASFRLSSHVIEATESRYLITLLRQGFMEEDVYMPSGQLTPPASEDNNVSERDGRISYQMYFPPPPNTTKLDQLRHRLTTRNVFALLCHASLAGLSLHQALSDLHARLDSYMPPDTDNVGSIINYLSTRGIEDVRNDPETAVSLLAWSEDGAVRWEEGWREGFVHCAGMYAHLESCADFQHISPITRALLERAYLEMQLRVQTAEERLAGFEYSDLWPAAVSVTANASGPVTAAPAKAAADRLQKFFVEHYTREFGSWPPTPVSRGGNRHPIGLTRGGDEGEENVWLTRAVAQLLQKDFAALYDYLVDRDIVWDESEARPSRKWRMVSESETHDFEADTPDLPITDMLIEFDNKHRFPHIPHPYPLVPESIPPSPGAAISTKASSGSMFGSKSSKGNPKPATAAERRIQLAYTEAANISALGSESTCSNLIDAFAKFEKADCIGEIDPSTARRGRWVLIYGILQTLASVSVDAPGVRYSEGVKYHLSPRLRGIRVPPWGGSGLCGVWHGAAHDMSHCWAVAEQWERGYVDQGDSATSPVDGGYGGQDNNLPMSRGQLRNCGVGRVLSTPTRTNGFGSSAASVVSYHSGSDTGSGSGSGSGSGWSPMTNRGRLRRENTKVLAVVGRGLSNRRVALPGEEQMWTESGQRFERVDVTALSDSSVNNPRMAARRGQWRGGDNGYRGGRFFGVDHSYVGETDVDIDVDEQSFAMSAYEGDWERENGRRSGAGAFGGSGSGAGPDRVGPVIRDFDELGVVDW